MGKGSLEKRKEEKEKEEKEKEKKKLENEDFTFEKRINCIEDLRQKGIHKACVLLKEREEKEKEKEKKDYEKAIRSSIPKRPVSLRYHPTPRDTLDRLITLSKSILVPPPTSFLLFLLFLFFLEKLIGFIGKWWYFWVNNCFI